MNLFHEKEQKLTKSYDLPPVPNTSLSCSSQADFLGEISTLFLFLLIQFPLTFTLGSHRALYHYKLGQFHPGRVLMRAEYLSGWFFHRTK